MKFSLFTVLGLIFVVLKLTNYIDWSWWFVLMPFYIGIVLAVAIYVGLAIAISNSKNRPFR